MAAHLYRATCHGLRWSSNPLLLIAVVAVCVLGVSPAYAAEPAPVTVSPASPDLPAAGLDAELPNAPGIPVAVNSAGDIGEKPSFTLAALSESSSLTASSGSTAVTAALTASGANPMTQRETDLACQAGTLHGKVCHVRWLPVLWQSFEANAMQNAGNIGLDDETRGDLRGLPYWSTYVLCVDNFRYNQWRDDDDFLVDYVGHGMQGAGVASIYEQNDPHGRGLVYVNNGNYWRSRLKAMAYVSVYEVQWKLGPAGEASIGNSGRNTYYTPSVHGRTTNETGFQDLVDTPIVGFWWNVGEDAMDRFVMPKIWSRTHNRMILTGLFFLTPTKAAANIMRFKPLYYRDFAITPLR